MTVQRFPHEVADTGDQAISMGLTPGALQQSVNVVVEQLASCIAAQVVSQLPEARSETEPWHLLDVNEAATRLGRSTRWVRERAKRGELPFVRLDGGALSFELEDVQAFARARRISADEPSALAGRLQGTRDPRSRAALKARKRATNPEVGA
jgi:excisionase family DNA binding protein